MIYLNQAATTYPKPQCVLDAHTAALCAPPAGQFRGGSAETGEDPMDACRKALGRLLGLSSPGRLVFSSGATDSANALIRGLPLAGRRVLATCAEHNSILRPLLNWKDCVGTVGFIPCEKDGRVSAEALEAQLRETGAAAVFVNHSSNVTGAVQDLRALAETAHRYGALLAADLSQSAGCIPVEAENWGLDALLFTGHKALFGPQGTGGHWVRPEIPFLPSRFGGTGRDSRRLTYEDGDYEYEPGTQNVPGIAALKAGVDYVLERGPETIHAYERTLISQLKAGLELIPGVAVYGCGGEGGPVLSFNIRGLKPADTAYILAGAYGIIVRAGLQCAPLIHEVLGTAGDGVVRASVSPMNTPEDIRCLISAVSEIASGIKETV